MSGDKENGVQTFMIYGLYEGVNMPALHQYLQDSVDILSYWNHLPLLYFVKSKLNVYQMSLKLKTFFGDKLFIVAEVDPNLMNGWLPAPAWDWFRTPAPPFKPAPSPLGDLLGALLLPKNPG